MLVSLVALIYRLHTYTGYLSATCYKKMQLDTLPIVLNGGAAMRKEYKKMYSFYDDFIHRLHKGVKNHIHIRHTIVDQEKILWLTSFLFYGFRVHEKYPKTLDLQY